MFKSQVTAWKRLVLLLLLTGASLISRAQVYPVQLSTLVAPPYSIYLPDYASPGGEKLRLVLLQRDLTVQGYRLRFEMKVQVNGITIMQTSRSAVPPPITLQPGIPTVLGGSDLSWYVQPQNLEFGGGYSSSTYEQSRSLPEGPINITFTAYDYTRSDVQVSATASSFFYATRDNPPLLNYPACGMQVTAINPQFLNFSWLPQNTSSPNSALQTNYIFSLYAVLPAGYNFQDIVQSTRPVYSVTTQMPNLVYGPGEPPLVPGQSYAWRVQAVDASGRDIFRNNGYSETCNFIYSGDSSQGIVNYPPIQISAASAGPAQGKVSWATVGGGLSLSGYDGYRLYYRKAQGDYDWFSVDVNDSMYRVFDLEPSTAYECRLQGHKSGSYGPYTDIANFTTDAAKAVGCTDNTSMLGTPSGRPLAVATGGMNITYGPWDVQLLTVQALSSPGQFKGTCKVTVPFMGAMTFNAKFDNLTIDDSRNVTAGNIVFLSQGLQAWIDSSIKNQMGGSSYGNVINGTDTTNVTVRVSLANLDHLDVIDSSNGDIKSFTIPGNPPVVVAVNDGMQELTIKDSSGNTYALDNQGNLTQLSLSDGSLQNFFADASKVAGLNTLASGVGTVTFTDADSKYAFDAWKPFYAQASTILTGQYEKLSGGSGDYYVPQKAIGAGESDIVGLNIDLPDNMDEDSLIFATGKGTRLIWDPKDYTLNLIGGPAADAQEVYALYPKPGGGYYSLGKLLVSAYEHKDFTAVLIPVAAGGVAPQPDRQQYEDALNEVYNKVNISWKVVLDSAYTNTGWDANGDGLLTMNGSSFFSNALTGEPAALAKGYKSQRPVDNSKRYIFLLNASGNNSGDPGDLLGDMPRGTLYGFVFPGGRDGKESAPTTVAHELGHGQFNLEHTFSGDIALGGKGATSTYPNLMDYTGVDNVHLYKYQWSQVHQPGEVLGIFESDTAGQSMNVGDMKPFRDAGFFNKEDSSYTFFSPSGGLITLPKTVTAVKFWTGDYYTDSVIGAGSYPDGTLLGFTLNSKNYSYNKYDGRNEGAGYLVNNTGTAYVDSISKGLKNVTTALVGLPCADNGKFNFKVYQLSFDCSWPKENTTGGGTIDSILPVASMYNSDYADKNISISAKLMQARPYTQEAIDFLNQNNSCGEEYSRYLLQIADLISANPGSYTAYKSCTGDSLIYADTSSSTGKGVGRVRYRYKVVKFAGLLKDYITTKATAYAGILNATTPSALDVYLKSMCEADYKPLTAAQRIHILQVLRTATLIGDSWLGMGNNRENVIVSTIRETPAGPDQSKAILDALQANHFTILRDLIKGCDNELIGNNNFDELINGITVLIQNAYTDKKLAIQYTGDKILKWGQGFLSKFAYTDTWADGSDSIQFNVTGGTLSVPSEEYSGETLHFVPDYFNSVKAAPYDYVTLRLYNDVNLENGAVVLQKSADSIQSIPALYLYWILESNSTRSTISTIKAAVNVGLFAVGVGELEAAQGLRLALAIADNATLATSFVLDAGLRDKLVKGPNGQNWSVILKTFDAFNLIYGGARLGYSLKQIGTQLAARRALFNQLRASDKNMLNPAEQNALSAADDQLAQLEKETGTSGDAAGAAAGASAVYGAVTVDIVKSLLPAEFVSVLKTFGKTEDEIFAYFVQYHNVRSGQKFFNEIENFLLTQNKYNLARSEAYALWGYTTRLFYQEMNTWLRTGINAANTDAIAALLNKGLSKLPAYSGAIAYRAIIIPPAGLDAFIAPYLKEGPITWKDFSSCGGSSEASFAAKGNRNVFFEIEQLDARDISSFADGIKYGDPPLAAPELLIKGGSTFEVTSKPVFDEAAQTWTIKLKQIK